MKDRKTVARTVAEPDCPGELVGSMAAHQFFADAVENLRFVSITSDERFSPNPIENARLLSGVVPSDLRFESSGDSIGLAPFAGVYLSHPLGKRWNLLGVLSEFAGTPITDVISD